MMQMGSLEGLSRYQLALGLVFSDGRLGPVPEVAATAELQKLVEHLNKISRGKNACAFRAIINQGIDVVAGLSCQVSNAVADLAVSLISPSNPTVAFAFFADNPEVAAQVEIKYSPFSVMAAVVEQVVVSDSDETGVSN
jgi:hypothetical protein